MVIKAGIKFQLVLFFIAVFISNSLPADQNPQVIFEKANKLYLAREYSQAISLYQEIISNGYESAELFYNLGNSYFRIGKLGYAILYYEKAQRLEPKDEDIKHNLLLANLRAVDRIETLPEFFLFEWWEGLLNFLSLEQWITAALIFYFCMILSAGFYFFAGTISRQKTALITGLVSAGIFLLVVTLFAVRFNREVNETRGIIVMDTSVVKLAPEESSEDAFIIHEGLKVKIEDKVNEWVKIKLIDGKIGWIKEGEAEII